VGTAVQEVVRGLPETLAGREHERLEARTEHLRANGVPDELAMRVAALPTAYSALAVVEVARRLDREPLEVARVHSALGQRLNMDVLYDRVVGLPRNDRWQTMARATLRDDLQQVHAAITAKVLESGGAERSEDGDGPAEPPDVAARIDAWVAQEGPVFERALATLGEICRDESPDLARLSVGLRVARTLLG
jgi:glutamate dehydrogenase